MTITITESHHLSAKSVSEFEKQQIPHELAEISAPTDFIREVIAFNIRNIAESKPIGMNALADRAKVSRSQFFNVLRKTSSPSLDWVAKVAQALGVAPSVLLVPNYPKVDYPHTNGDACGTAVFKPAYSTPPTDPLQ